MKGGYLVMGYIYFSFGIYCAVPSSFLSFLSFLVVSRYIVDQCSLEYDTILFFFFLVKMGW